MTSGQLCVPTSAQLPTLGKAMRRQADKPWPIGKLGMPGLQTCSAALPTCATVSAVPRGMGSTYNMNIAGVQEEIDKARTPKTRAISQASQAWPALLL